MLEVKKGTNKDATNIKNLLIEYNEKFIKDYDDLHFYIKDEKNKYIAGVVAYRDEDCVSLEMLYVDEKYRKAGLGSKLVRHLEKEARKQKAKRIILNTFEFQAPNFYQKFGFKEFGRLEKSIGEYGRYFFVKEL